MLIILFLIVWIIFNGQITLEIVLFGLGIGALMYAFVCKFMDYKPSKEIKVLKLIIPGITYIFILIWEILKANLVAVRYICMSKYDIEPALVSFDVPLETPFARMMLANSITLTPGTITVEQNENHFLVHCLDKDMAEGMDESVFVKHLVKMENIIKADKREK